jgi:hypothetical protein
MASLNRDNVNLSVGLLIISGLGIGGIVVPASIMTTIICPDELIATVTALTLAIRVLGGAVGYSVYYNVFLEHFKKNVVYYVGGTAEKLGITSIAAITEIINLTGAGLINDIRLVPGAESDEAWNAIVLAGQIAYAHSYKYVYYVSIAFGSISIIASLFLKNIDHYMTDHIAVKYDQRSNDDGSHRIATPVVQHEKEEEKVVTEGT